MHGSLFLRWPFLAAVALVSAAVSDVCVGSIANTGAFGLGYFDTNTASIMPSLAAAVSLALTVIGLHVRAACRRPSYARRSRLRAAATSLSARRLFTDFPLIALMQFLALFSMENAEALLTAGHSADGLMWLGGPVVISVVAHLAIGAGCTFLAAHVMRAGAARFVRLVWIVLEFVLCSRTRNVAAIEIARRAGVVPRAARSARAHHISERAPPFSPISQLTFVHF